MDTESNKVLLVGIGETGLGTSQKIRTNKVKGLLHLVLKRSHNSNCSMPQRYKKQN